MQRGHRYDVYYVLAAATARKIVDGLIEALADRTYRLYAREPLNEFIADVSRLKIGEYQYVGFACDSAARCFEVGDGGNERSVGLELAVYLKLWMVLFDYVERRGYFVHKLAASRALG